MFSFTVFIRFRPRFSFCPSLYTFSFRGAHADGEGSRCCRVYSVLGKLLPTLAPWNLVCAMYEISFRAVAFEPKTECMISGLCLPLLHLHGCTESASSKLSSGKGFPQNVSPNRSKSGAGALFRGRLWFEVGWIS